MKKHVFDSYADSTLRVGELPKPLKAHRNPVNFDLKTTVSEVDELVEDLGRSFWDKIVAVVNVNNAYYQCLTHIMDTEKCRSVEDLKARVSVALKNGGETALIGTELISCCERYLKEFGNALDKRSRVESGKSALSSNAKTELDALENELAETKRITKIYENRVAVLKKEKRDLLNILHDYDAENARKISLKKLLKAEQDANSKLREMISGVFNEKFPNLNSDRQRCSTHVVD